jgi:hypothetical protein
MAEILEDSTIAGIQDIIQIMIIRLINQEDWIDSKEDADKKQI